MSHREYQSLWMWVGALSSHQIFRCTWLPFFSADGLAAPSRRSSHGGDMRLDRAVHIYRRTLGHKRAAFRPGAPPELSPRPAAAASAAFRLLHMGFWLLLAPSGVALMLRHEHAGIFNRIFTQIITQRIIRPASRSACNCPQQAAGPPAACHRCCPARNILAPASTAPVCRCLPSTRCRHRATCYRAAARTTSDAHELLALRWPRGASLPWQRRAAQG
jgi:hypothetical protein